MKVNFKDQKRSTKIIFYVVFFLGILGFILTAYVRGLSDKKYCPHESFIASDNWHLNSIEIDAEIVWQKQAGFPFNVRGINMGLGDHIVFMADLNGSPCYSTDKIFFFDLRGDYFVANSAEKRNYYYSITAAQDSYILIDFYGKITKISSEGTKVWQSLSIPFKPHGSIAYLNGPDIYIPTHDSLVTLNSETGRIIDENDIGPIYDIHNELAVVKKDDRTIQIVHLDSLEAISSISVNFNLSDDAKPVAKIVGNQLLLYNQGYFPGVKAYDIPTGQLIWEVEGSFYSYPVLLEAGLALYTLDNEINLYDISTGALLGSIQLTSSSNTIPEGYNTWVIGEGNLLAISVASTNEIIIIEINGQL